MDTIKFPRDELIEEIYQLCLKCKIDWFYQDYYKPKRKTISFFDFQSLYSAFMDAKLEMSKELQDWFFDY